MRRIVLAWLIVLGGCSSVMESMDTKIDYKSAGTLPPLDVPPDLTAPARDSRYVLPESGPASATLSGYEQQQKNQARLTNSGVLPQMEQLRIERPAPSAGSLWRSPPRRCGRW